MTAVAFLVNVLEVAGALADVSTVAVLVDNPRDAIALLVLTVVTVDTPIW